QDSPPPSPVMTGDAERGSIGIVAAADADTSTASAWVSGPWLRTGRKRPVAGTGSVVWLNDSPWSASATLPSTRVVHWPLTSARSRSNVVASAGAQVS